MLQSIKKANQQMGGNEFVDCLINWYRIAELVCLVDLI